MTSTPDIVVVVTDQQRHDQLGLYDDREYDTPNLNALARSGTIFDTAYACSTTCAPSRGALMTGLLPGHFPGDKPPQLTRHPSASARPLREGFWTVIRALRAAGYLTALFGKGHFSPLRADHGFQTMRLAEGLGLHTQRGEDDYSEWFRREIGEDPSAHLFRSRERQGVPAANPFPHEVEAHVLSWITREAVEYLQSTAGTEKPRLVWISFPRPHAPFDPPPKYLERYDAADCTYETERDRAVGLPAVATRLIESGFGFLPVERAGDSLTRKILTYRRALIHQIDDCVGALLPHLDMKKTVFFFTSDHGDFHGRRGLLMKTPFLPFEELARVPFFVHGAGIPSGRRIDSPVQNADVALTCLDLAGVAPPDAVFDTVSCLPHFGDDVLPERFVHTASNAEYPMVRRGKWKLFRHLEHEEEMLFNLAEDPRETNNLAGDLRFIVELEQLRAAMMAQLLQGPRVEIAAEPTMGST